MICMKKLNRSGFSKIEIIGVLCTIIILLAIGINYIIKTAEAGTFSTFIKLADRFAEQVSLYKDMYPNDENTYYLADLMNSRYKVDIINPFDKKDECNYYESFVVIDNNTKKVSLKCGNYLAVGVEGKEYSIYELSDWTGEIGYSGEYSELYTYKKDGVLVSDTYMLEKEFIAFYNKKENEKAFSIDDIKNRKNIEVVSAQLYREKKFVKSI